jgi:hypothetical protein
MGWHHANLLSRQGSTIHVDFEPVSKDANSNKPQNTTTAKNVWVNVERPGLSPTDKVSVVLRNIDEFVGNSNSGYMRYASEQMLTVDLNYAEDGRFTGQLPDLKIAGYGYGGIDYCRQFVATVINGDWQDDPVHPGADVHDFLVELANT